MGELVTHNVITFLFVPSPAAVGRDYERFLQDFVSFPRGVIKRLARVWAIEVYDAVVGDVTSVSTIADVINLHS